MKTEHCLYVFILTVASCVADLQMQHVAESQVQHTPPAQCEANSRVTDCLCSLNIESDIVCRYSKNRENITSTTVEIKQLFCISFNETIVYGRCVIGRALEDLLLNDSYTLSQLDKVVCGSHELNHEGMLCSECKPGYHLAVNCYQFQCLPEEECHMGYWAIYCAEQLLPVTLFFIGVTFFNIRLMSEKYNIFLLYAQCISIHINLLYTYSGWSHFNLLDGNIAAKIIDFLYSAWNLTFRIPFFSYCIGSITSIQIIALQYLTAFIPLVLIFSTYWLIELHARNVKLLVYIWRPFSRCFTRFRRTFDSKTTIIDVFASFLLLSYTKFLIISSMLLAPSTLHNMDGSYNKTVLLYHGGMDYLGSDHIPYFVIAVLVLIVFVLPPPLLLLLYPMRWFQSLLNTIRLNGPKLAAFIDAFQGYYKDGTNGLPDRRLFSALYFFYRIGFFVLYAVAAIVSTFDIFFAEIVSFLLIVFYILVLRPYKVEKYNTRVCIIVLMYSLLCTAAIVNRAYIDTTKHPRVIYEVLLYALMLFPALLMFGNAVLFGIKIAFKFCQKRSPLAFLKSEYVMFTPTIDSST